CSDSRVPANEITGTRSGEIFVHRNVANLVVHTDINMLSVLQYSVEVLKVEHVIVCGHYGCGGIEAALSHRDYGLINKWLRNIKDVYRLHRESLRAISDHEALCRRMVELNVVEQVYNLAKTSIIQRAWKTRGGEPQIHGWVYDVGEGLIRDLGVNIGSPDAIEDFYRYEIDPVGGEG
ncbi:MAG: carbonic anhydrase, partial [Polyangiaceae bacterium]|nr:carbonic anhydrase [Polyangiaceae bacterium]